MNVRTSSEMLAILSSAKTHVIDIVHTWWLDTTLFPCSSQIMLGSGPRIRRESSALALEWG